MILSSLILPISHAIAGMPPVPVYPNQFKYTCIVQLSQARSDQTTRYESTAEAQVLIHFDASKGLPFNGVIDLASLHWDVLDQDPNSLPLKLDPNRGSLWLKFKKTNDGFNALLNLDVNQASLSGMSDLNAHDIAEISFDSKDSLEVKGNIEERPRWNSQVPPQGLLMNFTEITARCHRS